MKKYLKYMVALAFMFSVSAIADTTMEWTGAQNSGTLVITSPTLISPTITGATLAASSSITTTNLAATTATITGAVDAGAELSSYTYTATISTNKTTQVYMLQSGAVVGGGETTHTQAFGVVFIATPNVVCTPTSGAAAATNGLVITSIASNAFEVLTGGVGTNFQWMAYGRVK